MDAVIVERVRTKNEHPDHCPVCGGATVPGKAEAEHPCPRCGHLLWFSSEQVGGVTVVHLIDNRVAVMELLDLLDIAMLDGSVDKLVLDFGGIQTVSSAALGKLIKLVGRARSVSGRLAFFHLHADLRRVLQITRLDRVFDTFDTEVEALAALGAVRPCVSV
jgi:anti-sigma B factor antagonist